jgi:hypothetical protein
VTCRAGLVHLTLPSFVTTWPAVVVASANLAYLLAGIAGLQPTGAMVGAARAAGFRSPASAAKAIPTTTTAAAGGTHPAASAAAGSSQVTTSATATVAAAVQSSPMMKPYQNRPKLSSQRGPRSPSHLREAERWFVAYGGR